MCGIAGGYGAGIREALLRRMCDIVEYRGPDDEGYYVEENVALGVRRLSIIDLETGAQPIHNEDKTIWLVFNGEIFNYVELRSNLESHHNFYTRSDTEVIVHLYEEMGERCLSQLNGMFAFALWDRKKQKLFIARDRVGVKPLYYFQDNGKLVFGSEVKSILEAGIEVKPDRRGIVDYMTLGYVLGDRTFFEGVRQLPPGHYAVLQNGQLRVEQYWDLEYKTVPRSEQETVQRLRTLLEEAVRMRLRSDVPLGCHLSGGIDSSIVTGIASRLLGTTVKTFTGAFNEGPEYDETFYSRKVSEMAHTEYYEVRPDGKDFLETLQKLVWYMDYPEVGPGIYPQYYVCRLAREHVKVILGGQGGDEVFAGYPWFVNVELEHIMADDGNPIRRLQAMISYLQIARQNGRFLYESKRLVSRLLSKSASDISDRFYRDRVIHSEEELSQMLTSDFRESISGYSPEESFRKIFNRTRSNSFMDKSQYYYIKTYLPGLLHVEDRTSMAVSLESRVPLCCDHNLLEFAATIEPSMRAHGSRLKNVLREAGKEFIPKEVYERTDKKGFPTPFGIWLREQSNAIREILLSAEAKARGVFKPEYVEKVIREEETGARSRGFTIFMMLCVEFWFRNFVDKARRQDHTGP